MRPLPNFPTPQALQLPRSSTRLDKGLAFCRILTRVRRDLPYQLGFFLEENRIYPSGAVVPIEEFGERPVVLENAGPDRPGRKGNVQPSRWILWAWDFGHQEWIQIAQTYAVNWEWAEVLKDPAIRALTPPRTELFDVLARGRELAGELLLLIDGKIEPEDLTVRVNVWTALYNAVPGRIVSLGI